MSYSVGQLVTATGYNSVRDIILQILNPSITGYGPNLTESNTATNLIVQTADHWDNLYDDINKCIVHQTGANMTGVERPAIGNLITASFVNGLASQAAIAVQNSSTVHPSQLRAIVSATTFTSASWNSRVEIVRTYTWENELEANYHFNLGGYLITNLGYLGTPSTVADSAYIDFVNQANTSTAFLLNYNRSNWLNYSSTGTSFEYDTVIGRFTATVTYAKTTSSVTITNAIDPPPILIDLDPVSSSTLYVSTGSIGADLPDLATDRKILRIDALAPFTFKAGNRSNPQTLLLRNVGGEPVIVTGVTASSNGVYGNVVSTATDLTGEFPGIVGLPLPFTIPSNDEYLATVYYNSDFPPSLGQVGVYYNHISVTSDADRNSLTVNTVQNVQAPDFTFDLFSYSENQYLYANWQTENSLTGGQLALAQTIADLYYRSNTDFGVINGRRRYGLHRNPDADGLLNWVNYTNTYAGGNALVIGPTFFSSVDANSRDFKRSLTPNKNFDYGFGYGDFYDKSLVDNNITTGDVKRYYYGIYPKFGSIRSIAVSLSNAEFNNSASVEAASAFRAGSRGTGFLSRLFGRDPGVWVDFDPGLVNSTGTYSVDVSVTVLGRDLTGTDVPITKTENLSLSVTQLSDRNFARWVSPIETNNAVVGISYDRIGGQNYLTVGIGMGADGSLTMDKLNYNPTWPSAAQNILGSGGDSLWASQVSPFTSLKADGIYNVGRPMYKTIFGSPWSSFLQTYGVWPTNPIIQNGVSYPEDKYIGGEYVFTANVPGTYTVRWSADNESFGSILRLSNGRVNGTVKTFSINNNWTTYAEETMYLEAGQYLVTFRVQNRFNYGRGNPGGIGIQIINPASVTVWSTLDATRTPYLYWQQVHRFNVTQAGTYRLGLDNLVKNNFPIDITNEFGLRAASQNNLYTDYFDFMTVTSDGNTNLTFNWNEGSSFSLTGVDFYDKTLSNLRLLPYYYSYFETRKYNITSAGPYTQKLIGMNNRGVVTVTNITPGFGSTLVNSSVYIRGIGSVANGRTEGSRPGYQYNDFGQPIRYIEGFAPVSKNWYASETNNKAYAADKVLAIVHPASILTNLDIANWGYDHINILRGLSLTITRIQVTPDYAISWFWTKVKKGEEFPGSYGIDENNMIWSIGDINRRGRSAYDTGGISIAIPSPSIDEMIYIVYQEAATAPGPRGFNDMTISFSYTQIPRYTF